MRSGHICDIHSINNAAFQSTRYAQTLDNAPTVYFVSRSPCRPPIYVYESSILPIYFGLNKIPIINFKKTCFKFKFAEVFIYHYRINDDNVCQNLEHNRPIADVYKLPKNAVIKFSYQPMRRRFCKSL